jgi:hypothetical protein
VRLKLILLAAQVVAAVSGQGSGMIDSVPPPTAKPSPPLPLPPLLLPRFFLRREDEDEDEDEDEEAAVSCFFWAVMLVVATSNATVSPREMAATHAACSAAEEAAARTVEPRRVTNTNRRAIGIRLGKPPLPPPPPPPPPTPPPPPPADEADDDDDEEPLPRDEKTLDPGVTALTPMIS